MKMFSLIKMPRIVLGSASPLLALVAGRSLVAPTLRTGQTFVKCYSVGIHPNRRAHEERKLNEKMKELAHKRETTVRDLLVEYERHQGKMGIVNVSSVLIQLAQLARRRGDSHLSTITAASSTFDHLARRSFDLLPKMSAHSLADVALAYSLLSITDRDSLERLWRNLEAKAQDLLPKDLTKLADALLTYSQLKASTSAPHTVNPVTPPPLEKDLAELPLPLETLVPLVARASVAQLPQFTAQNLISITTILPKLGEAAEGHLDALFSGVAEQAISKIHLFDPAQLEDLAWAFARAKRESSPLLAAIKHQGSLLGVNFDELKL